ncbi:LANO_0H20472g1_1 [Lachancea nothofagi CBS 11611]|uniref:Copper transport protein n=1 Tax=Lachancea nothofagi CBS 11611 TaxID=1266666 RepID=A0A1G4KND4_9SACH|nr:LANO_0H20472g1_1 [Lachancea nothofagi CBS 11611]
MASRTLALSLLVSILTVGVHAMNGMDDSMSSASMSMTASMAMSSTMASGMSMATGSSSSSSSMDMSSTMSMNTYLTPKYLKYPVLFEHLKANTKAQAFGIFVLIVAAAFSYKFLLFVSWCLEVKWFKQWNPTSNKSVGTAAATGPVEEADSSSLLTARNYTQDLEFQSQFLPRVPNLFLHVVSPSVKELLHDFVRLLLTFCSTMLIYMLMLVTMTYVLTYVFAVIVGISLAEIFFNRFKICLIARWELQRELDKKRSCKGGEICPCDEPEENQNRSLASEVSPNSTVLEKPTDNKKGISCQSDLQASCCCAPDTLTDSKAAETCGCDGKEAEEEAIKERQAREFSKDNEQTGTMDVNLTPAEKFA